MNKKPKKTQKKFWINFCSKISKNIKWEKMNRYLIFAILQKKKYFRHLH